MNKHTHTHTKHNAEYQLLPMARHIPDPCAHTEFTRKLPMKMRVWGFDGWGCFLMYSDYCI